MTTSRNHIDKINKQNIMTDTVVNSVTNVEKNISNHNTNHEQCENCCISFHKNKIKEKDCCESYVCSSCNDHYCYQCGRYACPVCGCEKCG